MTGVMTDAALDIRRIDSSMEASLALLFREIKASPDAVFFHPHAFDDETARRIASYEGPDLYVAVCRAGEPQLIGYGMLRGWEAGYSVPSLGIIISERVRRRGVGRALMSFLHAEARTRGCTKVRLKVYPSNIAAISLYKDLGYVFTGEEAGQLIGTVAL